MHREWREATIKVRRLKDMSENHPAVRGDLALAEIMVSEIKTRLHAHQSSAHGMAS